MYKKCFKRLLDILLSVLGIIILLPIYAVIAVFIKIDSKGPIFFCQERVGKNGKTFLIYKFRTMKTDTPKNCPTHLLAQPDQYITSVGKVLRKTSLDELPQLWNILCVHMSIEGPRPSLPSHQDLNALRCENGSIKLRPGLTGLAQISGRDELPIIQKAAFDGEYAQNITLLSDLQIFVKTFFKALSGDGVKEGKL